MSCHAWYCHRQHNGIKQCDTECFRILLLAITAEGNGSILCTLIFSFAHLYTYVPFQMSEKVRFFQGHFQHRVLCKCIQIQMTVVLVCLLVHINKPQMKVLVNVRSAHICLCVDSGIVRYMLPYILTVEQELRWLSNSFLHAGMYNLDKFLPSNKHILLYTCSCQQYSF